MNDCIWLPGNTNVKITTFLNETSRVVEQKSNVAYGRFTFSNGLILEVMETADGTMLKSNGYPLRVDEEGRISIGI